MVIVRPEFDGHEGDERGMTMRAVGPVADAFGLDRTLLGGIMGPFGSAKTTTCFKRYMKIAFWQGAGTDSRPMGAAGTLADRKVYRARIGVIRDTYGQLEKNILKSWHSWFPKDIGKWSGRAPMEHNVPIEMTDAKGESIILDLELLFLALGEQRAEDVLKGLELTALHMNETDTNDRSVLSYGLGRIGRYPPARLGGCNWAGVIGDFNAPDIDNWTYDVFVEGNLGLDDEQLAEVKAVFGEHYGVKFFRQPGGMIRLPNGKLVLNPDAENLMNLPKGYYLQLIAGQSENWIRRYVLNEFGAVRDGQPVYPEWKPSRKGQPWHLADGPIEPLKNVPLMIGVDGGTTPAAVIGQRDSLGQIRILDELVIYAESEDDELERIGAEQFGKMLREHLLDRYADCEIGNVWRDPATDAEEDRSWGKYFSKGLGIKSRAAPLASNAITPRLEAVRKALSGSVEGGEPSFVLSPRCRHLRRGFNNGYVYARVKLSSGSGRWTDRPVKNDFSHAQDALQYLMLGFGKGRDLPRADRTRRGGAAAGPRVPVNTEFNPLGGM